MDYYALLGVQKNATQAEIRAAYLNKISKMDRNSPEFQQINTAYQTLSDTNKRNAYDQSLRNQSEFGIFTPRPNANKAQFNTNESNNLPRATVSPPISAQKAEPTPPPPASAPTKPVWAGPRKPSAKEQQLRQEWDQAGSDVFPAARRVHDVRKTQARHYAQQQHAYESDPQNMPRPWPARGLTHGETEPEVRFVKNQARTRELYDYQIQMFKHETDPQKYSPPDEKKIKLTSEEKTRLTQERTRYRDNVKTDAMLDNIALKNGNSAYVGLKNLLKPQNFSQHLSEQYNYQHYDNKLYRRDPEIKALLKQRKADKNQKIANEKRQQRSAQKKALATQMTPEEKAKARQDRADLKTKLKADKAAKKTKAIAKQAEAKKPKDTNAIQIAKEKKQVQKNIKRQQATEKKLMAKRKTAEAKVDEAIKKRENAYQKYSNAKRAAEAGKKTKADHREEKKQRQAKAQAKKEQAALKSPAPTKKEKLAQRKAHAEREAKAKQAKADMRAQKQAEAKAKNPKHQTKADRRIAKQGRKESAEQKKQAKAAVKTESRWSKFFSGKSNKTTTTQQASSHRKKAARKGFFNTLFGKTRKNAAAATQNKNKTSWFRSALAKIKGSNAPKQPSQKSVLKEFSATATSLRKKIGSGLKTVSQKVTKAVSSASTPRLK